MNDLVGIDYFLGLLPRVISLYRHKIEQQFGVDSLQKNQEPIENFVSNKSDIYYIIDLYKIIVKLLRRTPRVPCSS